jgi:hypothetical protein
VVVSGFDPSLMIGLAGSPDVVIHERKDLFLLLAAGLWDVDARQMIGPGGRV